MGVPFSHEVQKASQHIDHIAPTVKIALWTIICVSVILSILIATLLIAVIALLITVNPDLVEERKMLVTPALRAWLKLPSALVGSRWILIATIFFIVLGLICTVV
jgi:hypothetical protein